MVNLIGVKAAHHVDSRAKKLDSDKDLDKDLDLDFDLDKDLDKDLDLDMDLDCDKPSMSLVA